MGLVIYGRSDDLVELEGLVREEFADGAVVDVGVWEPAQGQDVAGVRVSMDYGPSGHDGGVWAASIAPLEEGAPIPWDVRVRHALRGDAGSAVGYSARVEIACPDGTPVRVREDGRVVFERAADGTTMRVSTDEDD